MSKDKDLLDIAKQKLKVPVTKIHPTEVGRFIRTTNITAGTTKIEAMRIYFSYRKWKNHNKGLLKLNAFFGEFKKYFTQITNNQGKCYLLNPEPFDLSEDGYWAYRKQLRNYRKYRGRKKRQSKKKKESPQKQD